MRLLKSPSQTCHAKPQSSNQRAPDATGFFPVGGMPLPQAAWPERLLSEKSGRCGVQQIKGVALYLIDRGDIRQAIDRCSNIWASLPELVMVSSGIRLTA